MLHETRSFMSKILLPVDTPAYIVFLSGVHHSTLTDSIWHSIELFYFTKFHTVPRIYTKVSRLPTGFIKIVTTSQVMAISILKLGVAHQLFHFSADPYRCEQLHPCFNNSTSLYGQNTNPDFFMDANLQHNFRYQSFNTARNVTNCWLINSNWGLPPRITD